MFRKITRVSTLANSGDVIQYRRLMTKLEMIWLGLMHIIVLYPSLINEICWDFQIHLIIQVRIHFKYLSISIAITYPRIVIVNMKMT